MHALLLMASILAQSSQGDWSNWLLLNRTDVQHELKLTSRQIGEISHIRELGTKGARRHEGRRPHPRQEADEPNFYIEPSLKRFGQHLSKAQRVRIAEISLQQFGPWVLDAAGVPKALGLTDLESNRIDKILQSANDPFERQVRHYEDTHKLPTHLVGGDMMVPIEDDEIRRIHKERDVKLMIALRASLSPQVAAKLDEMLGRPFKFQVRFKT